MNRNTIFRDANRNLWLLNNGQLVPYGMNDPATQATLNVANLYGTGLNLQQNDVRNLVWLLLDINATPQDLENWLLAHGNTIFYISGTNINIHPTLALRLLQNFGFRRFDDNGTMKIESVNHWLNNFMSNYFTNPLAQALIRNRNNHLLEYLENIVNFINDNPAILNHIDNYNEGLYIIEQLKSMP